ncbi:MAG TPA: hypothetical protein G4N98_10120 [Thermoflexia bacterium]|nr:hypothetical protein [Thermoflexia bacterium]
MPAVVVANEWVETARLFGDPENVITDALRNYSIEQCQQRINQAVAQITGYKQQYHCDYKHFHRAIQIDESFLTQIEAQNPLWEEDTMEWEYWLEEQQVWLNRLGDILRR